MILPKYICKSCDEPVGFFMASVGMLCESCLQSATVVQPESIMIPGTVAEQVADLERLMTL